MADNEGDWKSPADNETAITPSIRLWGCPGRKQPVSFDEKVAQKVMFLPGYFWPLLRSTEIQRLYTDTPNELKNTAMIWDKHEIIVWMLFANGVTLLNTRFIQPPFGSQFR